MCQEITDSLVSAESTEVGLMMKVNTPEKQMFLVAETIPFEVDMKYVPVKVVGKGSYGIVVGAIDAETNEKVAIKKIINVFGDRLEALKALREMKILRHIRHENVIALKDIMVNPHNKTFTELYLVYELMDSDLHEIIHNRPQRLSNDHCKYFLFQLLRGLKHLHSANIIHRDLKPANLLVNATNCDLKICDFGLARTNKGYDMTEYVMTRWYRAPELLVDGTNYGPPVDVWSVGCIFAEMLGREPILPGVDYLHQLRLIVSVVGSPNDSDLGFVNERPRKFIRSIPYSKGMNLRNIYPEADPLAIDLLHKMLIFNPNKRITIVEALNHPYMADLYDPQLDPPPPPICDFSMDDNLGEDSIKDQMWREMLLCHS